MAQADLHVHSKYSDLPSEWFLQRLGAAESYTEPKKIYKMARKRGMDFVTITDHNEIEASLELVKKHPKRCFTGVESTVTFPEDGCNIHLLIYGLDREQFKKVQKKRTDIYKLRDYLMKQDLACAVAHATYGTNGMLTLDHLEKLMLLFNNFEGRNGSRSSLHNDVLSDVLLGLTREDIEHMRAKHDIQPWGDTPWVKSLIGGTDDHAGFFIGKTSTKAKASTPQEFVEQIKRGRTEPKGRMSDFRGLTFAIYKVAFDFMQSKSNPFAKSTVSDLTRYLFDEEQKLSFRDRLRLNKLKSHKNEAIYQALGRLIENSRQFDADDVDGRLDLLYDSLTDITDQYFRSLLSSLNMNMAEMDIIQIIHGLSSSIPGIFLTVPFFSAFKHVFAERQVIKQMEATYGKGDNNRPKRILWLTDTLVDLNGVSKTLQTIGGLADEKGYDIQIMASLDTEQQQQVSDTTLVVPPIYTTKLPHYEELNINVPSVLSMLRQIYAANPDEIYISTPGPVGLLGLMIGRMLGTEIKGIYHTDFTMEAAAIVEEEQISSMIESYSRWFFNQFDTLLVPTSEYIQLLKDRGYRHRHMELFRRGLRTEHFKPMNLLEARSAAATKLLYVGRISKDKNLDFLIESYRRLKIERPETSLTLAGSGPYLRELQQNCSELKDITFTGQIAYDKLPKLYNEHDLFLFPSVTDTFGMVVLEAQACGLPAVVSNVGGPKEIVRDGSTGYVLAVDSTDHWVECLKDLCDDLKGEGKLCKALSQSARLRVENNFCWDGILDAMVKADDGLVRTQRHQPSLKRIFKLASNMAAF